MIIFCDIDGTLTDNSAGGVKPIPERVEKLRKLALEKHRIFLWSARGEAYCSNFAIANKLVGLVCMVLPKPDLFIDDFAAEKGFRSPGCVKVQTPEEWMGEGT